ncbi:MAG: hypothetical protein ACTSPB_11700 [Candidatus Thorarchaeota archaeon]
MVLAKWLQIRYSERFSDGVIVWQFYENGEQIGSRGISLTSEEMNQLDELLFRELRLAKVNGVEIKDNPGTLLEMLAKRAYDEYLQAKALEEEAKANVIE